MTPSSFVRNVADAVPFRTRPVAVVELEVADAADAAAELIDLVSPTGPGLAHVPGTDRLLAATIAVVRTFHALAADPQLALEPATFRHVSQHLTIQPDAPLDRLAVRGEVVARGRLGRQQGLDVRVTAVDAATGAAVAEGRSLVQAASPHPDTGAALARDPRRATVKDEPWSTSSWSAHPDRVARYAALTGDVSPLHVDPHAARAAGLAAPIVPGLLVLAPAAVLACGDGFGFGAVTGLAARFVRPVPVGGPIHLRAARPLLGDGARVVGLDAWIDELDGVPDVHVLRDAWISGT